MNIDYTDNQEEEQSTKKLSWYISKSQEVQPIPTTTNQITQDINFYKAYYSVTGFQFNSNEDNVITITIPNDILPLSVNVVNGFCNSHYLIECKFELFSSDIYRTKPKCSTFKNPYYGEVFPGSVLVKNRFYNFILNKRVK